MAETITIRGADGNDFFYARDRVLGSLLQMIKAGRVDEAADMYARICEDIAYPLIARVQADGPDTFRQLANLFFRARDYARAAYCCEHLEEPAKAAALYEQAGDFAASAQMFAASGNVPRAAEMFEKAGSLVEAAKLYGGLGTVEATLRAAVCFERAGRIFDAAQAWERANRPEKALALYNSLEDGSPDKRVAVKLARALVDRGALASSTTSPASTTAAPPAPTGTTGTTGTTASTANDRPTSGTDPGMVAHRRGPAPVPLVEGPAPPSTDGAGGEAQVTLMEGFGALKALPLFGELTLPELKSVYHLCQLVTLAADELLIEAGTPALALWIVLDGELAVTSRGGQEIARLAAGAHVGEMGLFDDAPANVDVAVVVPGRALRLDRRGFRDALAASDAFAVRVYRALFVALRDRLRATTEKMMTSSM
jgi:tetratricopeptide (TPR) repeat protein